MFYKEEMKGDYKLDKNRKFKLVILSRSFAKSSDEPLKYLQENNIDYELKRNNEPENEEKIANSIGDADAVIVGSEIIGQKVFDRCKNLKIISKHGVGLDSIDLVGAEERNIVVTNTVNANNESVADLTWLLILATSRNIMKKTLSKENFHWESGDLGNEVYRKTIGIIGYGNIGRSVARRGVGFDAKILVCDPMIKEIKSENGMNIRKVELDELFSQSDIISLHLPLNDATKHIINKKSISLMKDGVIIINTSRGDLIDENALSESLKAKKVKMAGLDVFSNEPPIGSPLFEADNLIATPHIATHSEEANYRMGMMAVKNVVDELKKFD
jgi:D-3-phosphoglycerate dehydrogenase